MRWKYLLSGDWLVRYDLDDTARDGELLMSDGTWLPFEEYAVLPPDYAVIEVR